MEFFKFFDLMKDANPQTAEYLRSLYADISLRVGIDIFDIYIDIVEMVYVLTFDDGRVLKVPAYYEDFPTYNDFLQSIIDCNGGKK